MAQSLNTSVDLTIKASCFQGFTSTGQVMIGDKAFEFYNEKNVEKHIQIPWSEVDRVEASVWFNKSISRFVIFLKDDSYYSFSTRDNKKTLRAINQYIPSDKLLRSLNFWDIFKRGLMVIPNKVLHKSVE